MKQGEERRTLCVHLPPDLFTELKLVSALTNYPVRTIVATAIREELNQRIQASPKLRKAIQMMRAEE